MGAFMLGPDYVQWYGFYEIQRDRAELEEMAEQIRINAEVQSQLGIEGSDSTGSLPGFGIMLSIACMLCAVLVCLKKRD